MKAIILAAGEGKRLRPFTLNQPKCLVEIDGRSLLERHIEVLRSRNVHPITLIGGYLVDMLAGYGDEVRYNPDFADSNMVWTLLFAERDIREGAIIAYGDIVYAPDILDAMLSSDAQISVAIDLNWEDYWRRRSENPLLDAESLKLSSDGHILEIGSKPTHISEIQGQYMGLIKLSIAGVEKIFETLRKATVTGLLNAKPLKNAYMTDLIQAVIDDGNLVKSIPVTSDWVEIDNVIDLKLDLTRQRLANIATALLS